LEVLEQFVAWQGPYIRAEAREEFLQSYQRRLERLADDQPLVFPKLEQYGISK